MNRSGSYTLYNAGVCLAGVCLPILGIQSGFVVRLLISFLAAAWIQSSLSTAQPPIDPAKRLNQHRVASRNSPAPEPGAERETIPSLVTGLHSPDDWRKKRRPEILAFWTKVLGRLAPRNEDRRWFGDIRKAVIHETQETEKYTRIRLDLPIEKDFYQKHLLLLPKNQGRGPRPWVAGVRARPISPGTREAPLAYAHRSVTRCRAVIREDAANATGSSTPSAGIAAYEG
jgi:hypothetical protein